MGTATYYCKTIAGSNIPELRLDRAASRRLMAVESTPTTPLGRIRIRSARTSTVGAELREARSTVFQECATTASKPLPNKRWQSRHHAEYSGLGRVLVRARKNKGKPTVQEYSNGKRTKEKRRRGWNTRRGSRKEAEKDGEFIVGTDPVFMSRPRGECKSLGERSCEGIGGRDGSTLT